MTEQQTPRRPAWISAGHKSRAWRCPRCGRGWHDYEQQGPSGVDQGVEYEMVMWDEPAVCPDCGTQMAEVVDESAGAPPARVYVALTSRGRPMAVSLDRDSLSHVNMPGEQVVEYAPAVTLKAAGDQ